MQIDAMRNCNKFPYVYFGRMYLHALNPGSRLLPIVYKQKPILNLHNKSSQEKARSNPQRVHDVGSVISSRISTLSLMNHKAVQCTYCDSSF